MLYGKNSTLAGQGAQKELSEGCWRGLEHHHQQEDGMLRFFTSRHCSPDNMAGRKKLYVWGSRPSTHEKCGRRYEGGGRNW